MLDKWENDVMRINPDGQVWKAASFVVTILNTRIILSHHHLIGPVG